MYVNHQPKLFLVFIDKKLPYSLYYSMQVKSETKLIACCWSFSMSFSLGHLEYDTSVLTQLHQSVGVVAS